MRLLFLIFLISCSSGQPIKKDFFWLTNTELDFFFPKERLEDLEVALKDLGENAQYTEKYFVKPDDSQINIICKLIQENTKCYVETSEEKKLIEVANNAPLLEDKNSNADVENQEKIFEKLMKLSKNVEMTNLKPKCVKTETSEEIMGCMGAYLDMFPRNKLQAETILKKICDKPKTYCLINNKRVGSLKIRPFPAEEVLTSNQTIKVGKKLLEYTFMFIR